MKRKRPTFEHACATYVHRYTMEHVPEWAKKTPTGTMDGSTDPWYYAPQYRTDREWYDNTAFPGEPHHHGGITHCWSRNASWPLGMKLDKPFKGGAQ